MEISNSFTADVNLFFENPAVYHTPPRRYSVLYLLRRDISTCMGVDPSSGKPIGFQALFPAAMAVLAGIDLLGKFLAGSDKPREVGSRFRRFIARYFRDISPADAEVIYQLRNALLHSFGLYSESKGKVYRFILVIAGKSLVQSLGNDTYLVDIRVLYDKFETAIASYRADLAADGMLQSHFSTMFPKYGVLYIR